MRLHPKLDKIFQDELHPLITGAIAGAAMVSAERGQYMYVGLPATLENEMKRAIMRMARAYKKLDNARATIKAGTTSS